MAAFTGFPAETLPLLRELPSFDRDTYAARKKEIQHALQDPAKAYVDAMIPALQAIRPGITGIPKINKSISPLNNDLRFAPEGTPRYKDHLLIWFWEGPSKKGSPGLGVRIHVEDGVGFGVGLMGLEKGRLDRWRKAIDGPGGDAIAEMIEAIPGADVAGKQLKRVPKPYDSDHRHEALLRRKGIQVRAGFGMPDALGSEAFVEWSVDRLRSFMPLHRLLVEEVV